MQSHIDIKNVALKLHPDPDKAAVAANVEASNTSGFSLVGILFRQGARYCISAAFPIKRVLASLQVDAAARRGGVTDVLDATNRPVMPDHVDNIVDYLCENSNGKYILPPMTLNVQQRVSVHMPDYQSETMPVHVVIPMSAKLSVTDGGHRQAAIIEALRRMQAEQRDEFEKDSVSVMITLEADREQVHQDFADCSKTKALPPSQLAAYDRRNPANGLVLDLIKACPLFRDKIDATSKTLSKNSHHLFLTNQVRQLVKELLVGDYGLADDQFEQKAKDILGANQTPAYAEVLERFSDYVNRVTKAIPVLSEIAGLEGIPLNKVKDFREEGHICLTATGLVILGRIGHELFKERSAQLVAVTERLGTIDWTRNAAIWQGNIVRAGKMTTQRAPVRIAAEKVRRGIGLPANPKLDADINLANRGDAFPDHVEEAA